MGARGQVGLQLDCWTMVFAHPFPLSLQIPPIPQALVQPPDSPPGLKRCSLPLSPGGISTLSPLQGCGSHPALEESLLGPYRKGWFRQPGCKFL